MRAGVYVWTAAALETFLQERFSEVIDEINSEALTAADLRYSLFALTCDDLFHTVRSADPRASYSARLAMLQLIESPAPVLAAGRGPLDGRTIRPYHFQAFWDTLGLAGAPWPSQVHRQVLDDVARARNDVAHGVVGPVEFGRTRTFDDCLKVLGRIDELVLHTELALHDYFVAGGYRR
jgi:hypothetical protein